MEAVSNEQLVAKLKDSRLIWSKRVERVLRIIDRSHFMPLDMSRRHVHHLYADAAFPLGHGAFIHAPHMYAAVLEHLSPSLRPGAHVLDVGCGSGFLLACMGEMVSGSRTPGFAFGLEASDEMATIAASSLEKARPELLSSDVVRVFAGGVRGGLSSEAPFDAIHVGAAAPRVPKVLLSQLAVGGRLIMPVGPSDGVQMMVLAHRVDEETVEETELGLRVRYPSFVRYDDSVTME